MLDESLYTLEIHRGARLKGPVNPGTRVLRRAIRGNIVSFPSQIPALSKQPPDGMQWRMVLLFFVRGWNLRNIAARFKVPKHRVAQVLNCWSVRALALGYVEVIDPEAFAECCRTALECEAGRDAEEDLWDDGGLVPVDRTLQFLETAPSALGPVATAQRKKWGRGFPAHTTTRLHNLGALAASSARPHESYNQTVGPFTALQSDNSEVADELGSRDEEHVSHAVA
jgi:hypothetical protein